MTPALIICINRRSRTAWRITANGPVPVLFHQAMYLAQRHIAVLLEAQ